MTQPTQPVPPRPMGPGPHQQPQHFPPQQQFNQPPLTAPAAPPVKKAAWWKSKPAIGIGALILGLVLGAAGPGSNGTTATPAPTSTVTITGAPGGTITQQVTTTATVATTVTAQPAPPAGTFKDGTWLVNKDIKPGQYRSANADGDCYWARLKNTEGGVGAILANGNPDGPAVVTIKATDVAFQSARCGEWQPV